jgi:hypothetical protein
VADDSFALLLAELVRRAKIASAKSEHSEGRLERAGMESDLRAQDDSHKAGRRFLKLAKKHPIEMPEKLWTREDLYE